MQRQCPNSEKCGYIAWIKIRFNTAKKINNICISTYIYVKVEGFMQNSKNIFLPTVFCYMMQFLKKEEYPII